MQRYACRYIGIEYPRYEGRGVAARKDPSTASTNQLTGRALRETEAKFQTVGLGYVSPEPVTEKSDGKTRLDSW